MATTLTSSSLLSSLQERGYTVTLENSRLHVSPKAPPKIIQEIRTHRGEILEELLDVPADLILLSLEEMRTIAWRLKEYIDGSDRYEKRVRFLPAFLRLVEAINQRMEMKP